MYAKETEVLLKQIRDGDFGAPLEKAVESLYNQEAPGVEPDDLRFAVYWGMDKLSKGKQKKIDRCQEDMERIMNGEGVTIHGHYIPAKDENIGEKNTYADEDTIENAMKIYTTAKQIELGECGAPATEAVS